MKISELNYQYKTEFRHREDFDITFRIQSDSLKFVVNYIFALKELYNFRIFLDNSPTPFARGGTYLTDQPFYVIDDMYEFLKGITYNSVNLLTMNNEEYQQLMEKYHEPVTIID